MKPIELRPGMRIEYRGTVVRVLGTPEAFTDSKFGMDLIRFWATREDTGAEGWVLFGPNPRYEIQEVTS